ncbi:unnamed protein product [Dovyalis caffra]|uniref:Uncharacterized protein n=1 Tax=Dovyalis caffra TaxID=77055 RepID=A0AAV1R1K6_9ROSI|nr:unnamed protein product [Dovyalis caffra]
MSMVAIFHHVFLSLKEIKDIEGEDDDDDKEERKYSSLFHHVGDIPRLIFRIYQDSSEDDSYSFQLPEHNLPGCNFGKEQMDSLEQLDEESMTVRAEGNTGIDVDEGVS